MQQHNNQKNCGLKYLAVSVSTHWKLWIAGAGDDIDVNNKQQQQK